MSPFRTRLGLLAAAVTLGAGLLPLTSASAHESTADASAKPTIVLVHGAWADASSWAPVVHQLQAAGYPVLVPPDPLRSLAGDAASLAAFLQQRTSGPVVLVGHSYGGAVISGAAQTDPDVQALVYVDAFAPDQGESVLQLVAAQPGSALAGDPAATFDTVGTGTDVDLYLKQSVFVHSFAGDLPPATAATLAVTQRPLTLAAAQEPSGPAAWHAIRSWYLVGTQDDVIPPAEQRAMATRAHAAIVEVPAGHLSMLSHPTAVTSLIRAAARTVH